MEPANGEAALSGAANEERGEGSANGERGSSVPANEERADSSANEERADGSANEEMALQGLANEERGSSAPANEEQAPGLANEERGSSPPANEEEASSSSNEDTALRGAANEERTGSSANEELWGAPGASSNGIAAPQGLSNEGSGNTGSANQLPGRCQVAGGSTNGDSASPQAPTNEIAGCQVPPNEDSSTKSPPRPPNEDAAAVPPPNERPACGSSSPPDAANELTGAPAPANGASDPWDLSREEAWLRAEGEGDGEGQGEEEEEEEEAEAEGAPWWLSPDSSFAKRITRRGRGLSRPGLGSLCLVRLAASSEGAELPAGAWPGRWRWFRLGSGEGRWAAALDACLETMAAGERCLLRPAGAAAPLALSLARFTPHTPFWEPEPTPGTRWGEVLAGERRAAALMASGYTAAAARAYARALRAAVGAGGVPPLPPERAGPKAELHAGLALCQLRLGRPAAAAANAAKALGLQPGHVEARYRRALASAAMSDLEAALEDLGAVLRLEPAHAGARRELRRVRGAARERDARLARRLGRLFA